MRRVFPLRYFPRRVSRIILREVLRRESAVVPIYDFKLEVPLQMKGIGSSLFQFRERELEQYEIIKSILNPGGCVLDIGGNIGYYCIMQAMIVGEGVLFMCMSQIREI